MYKRQVRIAQEEKFNKDLRRILKDILNEQALISHVSLDDAKTDSIFGTPIGGVASKSRPMQVSNIDSLQQEFDVAVQEDDVETTLPTMRPLTLIENKYIVAMGTEGLYIIDFHAAHERVMYERLKDQAQFSRIGKQELLKPISLELSKSEATDLEQMLPQITAMGLDAEKFGTST